MNINSEKTTHLAGIILFSAVTIHILPLSGVRRSSGWQQAFTFHLPQIIPNSFALPSNFTNSPQNYIPSSECCLTRDSNQHAYCFTTCLATIPACWLDIGNWDTGNALYNTTLVIIRRCFLSLTCDASFPPHFSYLLAKNITTLKVLPQNDLLIFCWCNTISHLASSPTVSPFAMPEIQNCLLLSRQQTALTSSLLNHRHSVSGSFPESCWKYISYLIALLGS
ncbi:hypothetical protein T11_16739 [Trichinella zimbabwensis]|uniref:Uncharacterized protein n=1 Tax=Trichinella zimbabwensis TaxID=268475 RepID=A0A0V1I2G8_9BILA|nr:hypothetical protein T11_16739 [Trichinella zimbabwensis]